MLEKLSISKIIRYGYGGFLLVGIILLFNPQLINEIIKSAGPVVAPIAIFSLGACIYIFYRFVLGEFIIYPISHLVHRIIDLLNSKSKVSGTIGFLRKNKVSFWQRRAAYNLIRWEFLDDKNKKRLDYAHSEIHILYITAVEFMANIGHGFFRMALPN